MSVQPATAQTGLRSVWSLGDMHAFARATTWSVGPVLVQACDIHAGQRVLDVATGSGNVALRAAATGARVTASDLTPAGFPAGQAQARADGVELDWVEADATALPFADGEFDVVTSCFGVMFAPDHRAVADELLRVCRPGGTIGLASFTPEGLASVFFGVLAPYLPAPPPGAGLPLQWGAEPYLRALFGPVLDLETSRQTYVETVEDPRAYLDLLTTTFGPVIAARAAVAGQPERRSDLDAALWDFVVSADQGPPQGPARYPYEYLLAVGTRADG